MSKNFELMSESKQLTIPALRAIDPVLIRPAHEANEEMRLRDVWETLMRRRTVVLRTLAICFLAATLICIFSTRRYKAVAQIQVGRETDNSLGLQTSGSEVAAPDALEENLTLQTQANILQSDTLALKVINDLNLEPTEDFRPKFDPLGLIMSLLQPSGPADPSHATLEESPRRRARALRTFSKRLEVKSVPGTRLIEISFLSPDPKLAAAVVNDLANSLVDYNFKIRHDATAHTAEWLAGQMADLRKQSEDLQTKVAQLQRETGVFSLGEDDVTGRQQVYSSVLDKLQQATTAYTQAQANRIGKAAIYQVAASGDPEAISQLGGTSIFSSSSGLDSSLTLIQNMRLQESTLRGQIDELSAKFGPEYPKLGEMQSHLGGLEGSIHAEVRRIADRAKNDYEVAKRVENDAYREYSKEKQQADVVNDKMIEYIIARKEADESRNLYESLFRQLKQSGVLAGFMANNISVVDPGRIPAKPSRPNVPLYLAASLVGGLILGAIAALIKDHMDTRLQNLVALEYEIGEAPLVVIPYHESARRKLLDAKPKTLEAGPAADSSKQLPILARSGENRKVPVLNEPYCAYAESLRALRTALLLSKMRTPPKVILVTSAMPGEGKSMLSANFAAILADQQKKVLLVDADLRHPSLHEAFKVTGEKGLSSILMGAATGQDGRTFEELCSSVAFPASEVANLSLVPCGAVPKHPAELLASDRMSKAIEVWRSHFDFIILDGPPVLQVTDAVVLSGLADFTLLTARYQRVEQHALRQAYVTLRSQTNNLGIVLNAVPKAAGIYYPAYGYTKTRSQDWGFAQ